MRLAIWELYQAGRGARTRFWRLAEGAGIPNGGAGEPLRSWQGSRCSIAATDRAASRFVGASAPRGHAGEDAEMTGWVVQADIVSLALGGVPGGKAATRGLRASRRRKCV